MPKPPQSPSKRARSPSPERKPTASQLDDSAEQIHSDPSSSTSTPTKTEMETEAKPKTSKPKTTTAARPWTGEEYVALFNHVVKHGARKATLGTAVDGRNGNQAYLAWW